MKIVSSVSEYLEYLNSIETVANTSYTISNITLYRGQANSAWELTPSLYRRGLFAGESLLLTELKHICPNEFLGNRFETLVKMQHYGMPTRLLDTTTNPLVALFFACEDINECKSDGKVYVFPRMPISWSTDPLIDLIMDYVFEHYPKKIWLDEVLRIAMEKYRNVVHRLMPDNIDTLLHYLTIPAFAEMPAKTNDRIEAQDGAFLIFGMRLQNREVSTNPGTLGHVYYNFEPVEAVAPEQITPKADVIIIPADKKLSILQQLDILGINERKLFPDLSHQIKHTVNSVAAHMYK